MTARSDFCLFRHGTETWACSTQVAGEIIEWRPHTPVPRAPGALRGALNLRGEILPLLSLDEFLLGKSSTVERRGSMLVLAAESVRSWSMRMMTTFYPLRMRSLGLRMVTV